MVRDNLAGFERRGSPPGALIRAAVAVVLAPGPAGESTFVITRRADRPGRHSGQWALPGGRSDPEEPPEVTALRELEEEISVPATDVEVLGLLDDYETRSGFVITPVVAWMDRTPRFAPDPREVAAVYQVGVHSLEHESVPRIWHIEESPRPLLGVPLAELETVIHAPTAALLFQLREVGLLGRATRVAGYEQPVFAWR
ncbi:MAG: CoA pyrophosphatase [Deltaproteobacteria bacterium]|nr:CoA pyrophosphatase [Deltaproteobacteria bacterium]